MERDQGDEQPEDLYDDEELDDRPDAPDDDQDEDLDDDGDEEQLDEEEDLADEDEEDTPPDASDQDQLPPGTRRNAAGRLIDEKTGKLVPEPTAGQRRTPGDDTPAPGASGTDTGEDPHPETPEGAEPLTFTANRQPFHVRGSYLTEDGGAYLPRHALADVQRLLAAGQHHLTIGQQQYREYQQQLQELRETRTTKEQQADHVLDFFTKLVRQGPAAVIEWAGDLEANWDKLQLEAEKRAIEEENRRLKAGPQRQEQQQRQVEEQAAIEEGLETALLQTVDREYREAGFTKDDLVPVYRILRDVADSVIFRAEEDLYDQGVLVARQGQLVVDYGPIRNLLARESEHRKRTAQTVEAQRKAAEFNARRKGLRSPPPAVRGRKAPAGGEEGRPVRRMRPPRTKEEADALLSRPVDEVNQALGYRPGR